MKKVINFFAMAVVVLSLGLTGCGKEDTAEPLNVDANKVATVKGIAHARLDQVTTSTSPQYAPSGTKVFLKVKYDALSSLAETGDYLMVTTVGSDGAFTFEKVPVANGGSTATISGDQFTASVKIADDKSQNQKFVVSNATASLLIGSTGFVALEYTGSAFE